MRQASCSPSNRSRALRAFRARDFRPARRDPAFAAREADGSPTNVARKPAAYAAPAVPAEHFLGDSVPPLRHARLLLFLLLPLTFPRTLALLPFLRLIRRGTPLAQHYVVVLLKVRASRPRDHGGAPRQFSLAHPVPPRGPPNRPDSREPRSLLRPFSRRWLMTSLHQAALGFQMLLRCGRVDSGRLARPRLCKGREMVFKPRKRRATATLIGRPQRRLGHKSAGRDARVSLYRRHVLARRVSRAGGRFEFRVVVISATLGQPRSGLRRLLRPLGPPARSYGANQYLNLRRLLSGAPRNTFILIRQRCYGDDMRIICRRLFVVKSYLRMYLRPLPSYLRR